MSFGRVMCHVVGAVLSAAGLAYMHASAAHLTADAAWSLGLWFVTASGALWFIAALF